MNPLETAVRRIARDMNDTGRGWAIVDELEILPSFNIPVARVGHLLALKVLARDDRHRPQDWDDIRALLREADGATLAEARAAVQLIEQRGYQRGKRLEEQLERLIRESAADDES